MTAVFSKSHARCILLLGLLGLTACTLRNAPVHFYMLNPVPQTSTPSPSGEQLPPIGVGPISMAGYLNRPQIVTRSEQNRLQINETHQWAENPRTIFLRVLTQNLSQLLGSNQVFAFPWRREARIRYQVIVDVDRFDGEETRTAVLQAGWSIVDTRSNEILVTRRADLREPTNGIGFDKLVEAQSRALAELSRQIADGIREILNKKS